LEAFVKMRTVLTALIIIAAGVSTASAQQAATDHSGGAGASQPANAAGPASGKAAAAAGGPLTPSQSTDFVVNGSNVIRAAPPRTPEQQKADAKASAAWQARCRPSVIEDRDGVRRRQYAEPDCDLSRYNTAGAE
jgi:hypothetical protein